MGQRPHFAHGDLSSFSVVILWIMDTYKMKKAKNEAIIKTILIKPFVSSAMINNIIKKPTIIGSTRTRLLREMSDIAGKL